MGNNTEVLPAVKEVVKWSANEQLSDLLKEYEKAKELKEKQVLRLRILELKREINRTKQFTSIAWNKNIEGKNDLDSISASNLMRVDKELWKEKRGEFLSKSFLYKRSTDSEGIISEEPTDGRNLKEGDILFVDFGKNKSAEGKIWAWDLLSLNFSVIKVTDSKGNIRIWKRSIQWNKVGYFDEKGYIEIYNGYSIEIPKKSESDDYIKNSNPSITISDNEDVENKAKDAFIEISDKYEAFWETFTPWNILERKRFLEEATIAAKNVESTYGIPWKVTYAQAALETWYGKSAPGNNYFGIKWGTGKALTTKEFVNGSYVQINANFRTYNSMQESFDDYGKLLNNNSRYKNAFNFKDDPEKFLSAIIASGYATDPAYVSKAVKIWDKYDTIKKFNIDTPELIGKTTPDELIKQAWTYEGTKYAWGWNSINGIDCSHLVCKALSDLWAASPSFYRVAAGLRDITPVKPIWEVKRGDLIFFHGWVNWVSHVAIATGQANNWEVEILDAAWYSSWIGKVSFRKISLTWKMSAGTPPFYS